MKVKLFSRTRYTQSIEDFERAVNDFMATVEVVDVKYSETTVGTGKDLGTMTGVLVIYK
ncbi:hypothetical protein SM122_10245 [Streptococcus sp. S2(2023)]|uniref:DUF2758 domain-containing protein n=1 Tax=Streptococcus gingivalis TaxID=3111861 RepID=A0ABU6BAP7_9STRE|nr:hypothetical protein [Streptococcus sp. S2(2023)]MEB3520928.1 hypothetical protein [Streptococcus sp. S2(2023)]